MTVRYDGINGTAYPVPICGTCRLDRFHADDLDVYREDVRIHTGEHFDP